MISRTLNYSLMVLLFALPACTLAEEGAFEDSVDSVQSAITYDDSSTNLKSFGFLQHVFGYGLNGRDLNGRLLDGSNVSHIELDSASLDGKPMSDVTLNESKFRGRDAQSRLYLNAFFRNVEFTARTDVGTEIKIRIENARRWLEPGRVDTFLYQAEYETLEGWRPLCGVDDSGIPVEAIALNGRWDYREGVEGGGSWFDDANAFTFACRGHVAAKCLEMGYEPWRRGLVCHFGQGCRIESIGHLHQACTRLMRGDYCGDGSAHTVDGMRLNIYDGYGIRLDSEDWDVESEWTPDGALCLARARLGDMSGLPCYDALTKDGCGDASNFVNGTSLISEIAPLED